MINRERVAHDIVTVGASAGGVEALVALLRRLPADIPAAIAVVLHRSPYYETKLPQVLGRESRLEVLEPVDGVPVERGRVYVAPRDQHLVFADGHLRLHRGPKEHWTRPAVAPLFVSAAGA